MSKARNRYTEEFKREAVRLVKTSGKTVAAIERELGLSHNTLRKWCLRYNINEASKRVGVE